MNPATGLEIFSLNSKTAIVTGACGLLGRKHCEILAAAGARVAVADINEEKCLDFANELGKNHIALHLDVTQSDSLKKAHEKLMRHFGRIDILVNNAAMPDSFEHPDLGPESSGFENYPLSLFQKAMDVNVTGVFLCSQVFGKTMADQKSGSIINIASTYGMVGPDQSIYIDNNGKRRMYKSPVYPTTKGAVINFTRYLASYWGNKGVRVNSLSPGGVENQQDDFFVENYAKKTLLGRMAQPTDYQGALLFLASSASSYMTGANLVVDGGWTAI